MWIWAFIDFIIILRGNFKDAQGRHLKSRKNLYLDIWEALYLGQFQNRGYLLTIPFAYSNIY